MLLVAPDPPAICALAVDGKAPGDPDQPCAKAAAIAKAAKVAVRPDERLLRHVFRVLALPEDTEGDAEGECGRLGEQAFELVLDVVRHAR
jgi:hypothetical protein